MALYFGQADSSWTVAPSVCPAVGNSGVGTELWAGAGGRETISIAISDLPRLSVRPWASCIAARPYHLTHKWDVNSYPMSSKLGNECKGLSRSLTNKELSSLHVSHTDLLRYPADVHPKDPSWKGRQRLAGWE